jgi:hypothetical protein
MWGWTHVCERRWNTEGDVDSTVRSRVVASVVARMRPRLHASRLYYTKRGGERVSKGHPIYHGMNVQHLWNAYAATALTEPMEVRAYCASAWTGTKDGAAPSVSCWRQRDGRCTSATKRKWQRRMGKDAAAQLVSAETCSRHCARRGAHREWGLGRLAD